VTATNMSEYEPIPADDDESASHDEAAVTDDQLLDE